MPRRRRQQAALERVLGTPALFATAYGNVGSSIYYALGVTAAIALGLTPLVFVIAGLIFAATAVTYAEGTVRYPEAGGSSSFARHAFNELVSFGAAWAQMLDYVITVAISAFFVPHYLSIFWEPLRTNPWDIVGGAIVIVAARRHQHRRRQGGREPEHPARRDRLRDAGAPRDPRLRPRLQPAGPDRQRPPRHRADVEPVLHRDPDRDDRLHRRSRRSRTSRRRRATPRATCRRRIKLVAVAVFAIYLTLPLDRAVGAARLSADQRRLGRRTSGSRRRRAASRTTRCSVSSKNLGIEQGALLDGLEVYVGVLAATILFIATNAGVIGASRITYAMSSYRQLPDRVPPPAPEVQDAVARARRLRRASGRSSTILPGDVDLPRDDVLLRRDAVVHDRALRRSSRCAPGSRDRRGALLRPPEPPHPRRRLAALRAPRRDRDRRSPGSSSCCRTPATRWAGFGWLAVGFVGYVIYRRRVLARAADGDGARAGDGARPVAHRRVPDDRRPGHADGRVGGGDRRGRAARGRAPRDDRAACTCSRCRWSCRSTRRSTTQELEADELLDERAGARRGATASAASSRLVRARIAGQAIVEEALRRNAELIVVGAPRGRRRASGQLFGRTADYVLKHSPVPRAR